jgi:pimeloyl-ACP methyl ester carboxylesterase
MANDCARIREGGEVLERIDLGRPCFATMLGGPDRRTLFAARPPIRLAGGRFPCEDDSAGWCDYADTVVEAVGDRRDLVVVGHSLGGFTAPLVCERVPVELLVLFAAMIPSPSELFADGGRTPATRKAATRTSSTTTSLARARPRRGGENGARTRRRSRSPGRSRPGLTRQRDTSSAGNDRMFPAAWARRHARERLDLEADEIDGGHYITLSRPRELAERLTTYAANLP